jgi:hypothetical protein
MGYFEGFGLRTAQLQYSLQLLSRIVDGCRQWARAHVWSDRFNLMCGLRTYRAINLFIYLLIHPSTHSFRFYIRGSRIMRRASWGAQVVCVRDIFILNKLWAQDKIYILIGTLLGWNILLLTQYYRYWLRTISSIFGRRMKLEQYVTR